MVAAALLTLLALAPPNAGLARAEDQIASLDYGEAAETLMSVLGDASASDDDRVRAHLLLGLVKRIDGNDTEARMHFLWALHHDPAATLPPIVDAQSPKVATFFELVREEVRASTPPPPPAPPPAPAAFPWLGVSVATAAAVTVAGAGTAAIASGAVADKTRALDERKAWQAAGLTGLGAMTAGLVGAGVAFLVLGSDG